MADYRDYGYLRGGDAPQVEIDSKTYTQVYRATHKGENYLPFMNRSFISFSFGGRNIEEFNLIATVSGDRMERDGYAAFDDLTSSYDVVHGQFYWGTYYRTNQLTFQLSTDGIEQRQLDEFLLWFSAGKVRELILAEHPNRAIMARVSEPPQLHVLPFEKQIRVRVGDSYYNTSTTIYKGDITLNLVMDEPHWYSKINIFGEKDEHGIYRDVWFDPVSQTKKSALEIPDAIKVIYEDGIPLSSMIIDTVLLGGNVFAVVEAKLYSTVITTNVTEEEYNNNSATLGYYNNGVEKKVLPDGVTEPAEENPYAQFYKGAVIATVDSNGNYITGGRVGGAAMNESTGIDYLAPVESGGQFVSFYYAGTAPSPVTLSFSLNPIINQEGYICNPNNQFATMDPFNKPYNTITMQCINTKEFKFTTPNLFTSFNNLIKIFETLVIPGQDWANVREVIRESIWHSAVRAWANRVIDIYDVEGGNGIIENVDLSILKRQAAYLLTNEDGAMNQIRLVFNGKTGEAIGTFRYRDCINRTTGEVIPFTQGQDFSEYCLTNLIEVEENVGDMVKSKYLIIDERNYPDDTNNITKWQIDHNYAHRLYHDVPNGLYNVLAEYKNMYL